MIREQERQTASGMLMLVVFDLVPQAFGSHRSIRAGVGSVAGAAAMLALAAVAGV